MARHRGKQSDAMQFSHHSYSIPKQLPPKFNSSLSNELQSSKPENLYEYFKHILRFGKVIGLIPFDSGLSEDGQTMRTGYDCLLTALFFI